MPDQFLFHDAGRPRQEHGLLRVPELLIQILECLPTKDLLSAGLVCLYWNLACTDILWSTRDVPSSVLLDTLVAYDPKNRLPRPAHVDWESLSQALSADQWNRWHRLVARKTRLHVDLAIDQKLIDGLHKLSQKFNSSLPLCPSLKSIEFEETGDQRMGFPGLLVPTSLVSLTTGIVTSDLDNGFGEPTRFLFESLNSACPRITRLHLRSYTYPFWTDFTIDYGAYRDLRHLTVYDISFASWKTLEACPKLEVITLEDGSRARFSSRRSGAGQVDLVTLPPLRKLVFNAEDSWSYPSRYIILLLGKTNMPALRSLTVDVSSLEDRLEVLEDLFNRSQTIEEVTIRHYTLPASDLIDLLRLLKSLRSLTMVPFGSRFTNEDMAYLSVRLEGLEELSIRSDGGGARSRVGLEAEALLHLAGRCCALKKLNVDFRVPPSFDSTELRSETITPMPNVRQLHITPVDLSNSLVPLVASFLVTMFPSVEVLSVVVDKYNSDWTPNYKEHTGLANAFTAARQARSTTGKGQIT